MSKAKLNFAYNTIANMEVIIESLRAQLAEVTRERDDAVLNRDAMKSEWDKAYEITQLTKQQLEAAKVDAKRYRALKNGDYSVECFVSATYGWNFVPTAELDGVLDAEMGKEQPC